MIHECAGLVAMTQRPLILPLADALDDLVVGPAGFRRDAVLGDAEDAGDLGAVVGVGEVVAAEQVGGVGEEPRPHRVALAGDRVRPGPGPADVAGQQREVDDRLRGADPLVALVHPHRPPERDPLLLVDQCGECWIAPASSPVS